jgi:hypothetical protein
MMVHPFRNNHQSCQSIRENATLFLSEHTLFSCDLQWMPPKVYHFAVKSFREDWYNGRNEQTFL